VFTVTRGRRLNAFGQSVTERELQEQEDARIAAEERDSRIMARMASGKEFVPEAVRLEDAAALKQEHERQRDLYIMEEKGKADSIEREGRLRFEKEASDNSFKDYRMPDYNITYDMTDYSTFPDYINAQDYENAEKEKADSLEREARRRYKEEEALENSLENYDMTDYDGGKRKKKKYTQRRQKKQRRRHRHRRSTKKYHRK
jgi:hypothetical protein